MYSTGSVAPKDYVDRGVQTSSPYTSVSPATTTASSSRPYNDFLRSVPKNLPSLLYSTDATQLQNAYDHSFPPDSSSPARSSKITRRTHKERQLPYNRPSESKKLSQRIVSLPETAPPRSTETLLDSTTLRLASMPDRIDNHFLEDSQSSTFFADTFPSGNDYLSDTEETNHSRIGRSAFDVPHTPSPPSSPDSVVIIENSVHLPEAFLRNKPDQEVQRVYRNDEGWISWANSPPRPIPALHGPLSLPYARCPSGAEGTIIEESNDLSRMIWGLGEDEPPAPQSHQTSSFNPYHGSARKQALHSQSSLPPRLMQSRMQPISTSNTRAQGVENMQHSRLAPISDLELKVKHQTALENLGSRPRETYAGPTALDNIIRTGEAKTGGPLRPLYGQDNRTVGRLATDLRALDMDGGLFLDWQSALAQRSLRDSVIDPGHETKTEYLKPSAPVFVPASQASQLSYPRIFVEPRPRQNSHSASQSRRVSAIDIAQRYRQQQQVEVLLPTPPNSSSPQWSYNFSPYSPYEEYMLSPSSRQTKDLSPAVQYQQPRSSGDLSQQLRKHVSQRSSNTHLNTKDADITSFSPIQIDHDTRILPVASHSKEASFSHIGYRNAFSTPPSNGLAPHPGPPPSTPLPPVPNMTRHFAKYRIPEVMTTTPPSPTSPDGRTCALSSQQPRSIPLARLIQRRLSAVPEEDTVTSMVYRQSASPSPSQKPGTSESLRQTPQQLLSPSIPQQARTPSPVPATMTPQSRAGGEFPKEPGMKKGPQVRLPYIPSMVHGQPGDDHHFKSGRHGLEVDTSKENIRTARTGGTSRGTATKKRGRGRKARGISVAERPSAHTEVKGGRQE